MTDKVRAAYRHSCDCAHIRPKIATLAHQFIEFRILLVLTNVVRLMYKMAR
jgi:hypothetical protein